MDLLQMRFPVGTRVVSKRTGPPASGTVMGCILGSFDSLYHKQALPSHPGFSTWNTLYPDWADKLVYEVKYDQWQRTISWEEYQKFYPGLPFELYDATTPFQASALFPEDDLEPL
jgi:hypothetical protein